jgi:hypothetical protein
MAVNYAKGDFKKALRLRIKGWEKMSILSAAPLTLMIGLLAAGYHSGGINPGTVAKIRLTGPMAILRLIPMINTIKPSTQAFQPFGQSKRRRSRNAPINMRYPSWCRRTRPQARRTSRG